jgi:FixJ family two-component response regulator
MGKNHLKKTVFHVDDEPGLRRLVPALFENLGCNLIFYETAGACLNAITKNCRCDLIVTDVVLSDMDGITFLNKIRQIRPMMPVLFLTYFGTISIAVEAMKHGAIDFIKIEKPIDTSCLSSAIHKTLMRSSFFSAENEPSLTAMEARILQMVADGKSNSEIAYLFGCSVRTVECHRNRVMHKLRVNNTASLVKKAIYMKLTSVIGTGEGPSSLQRDFSAENFV